MNKLTLSDLKDVVFNIFINNAKAALYQFDNYGVDWDKPANTWCGDLTGLPDCLTYNDLQALIEEKELTDKEKQV
jgi:hypothetical protein